MILSTISMLTDSQLSQYCYKEVKNNTADSAEVEKIVAEKNKPSNEKSESSAVEADKTDDESKR